MPSSKYKSKKIAWIEFCRFIAAFCIVWLHFGYAPILMPDGKWATICNSYLFVEYFFILTGYFSVAHFEKIKDTTNSESEFSIGRYVLRKYIFLLPYVILSASLAYPLIFVNEDPKKQIFNFPLEILCPYTGIVPEPRITPLWYVGAMIIALPILLFVKIKLNRATFLYTSIIIPMLLYGYLLDQFGTLDAWASHWGILRAIAGMFLGAFLHSVSKVIASLRFTFFGKIVITIIEISAFSLAIVYTFFENLRNTHYDIFFVFLIFVSLLCTFSNQSLTRVLPSRFLCALGNLSLPIFIFHIPIIFWVKYFFPNIGTGTCMLLVAIFTIIISFCSLWIVKYIFPAITSRLRHILIISE